MAASGRPGMHGAQIGREHGQVPGGDVPGQSEDLAGRQVEDLCDPSELVGSRCFEGARLDAGDGGARHSDCGTERLRAQFEGSSAVPKDSAKGP